MIHSLSILIPTHNRVELLEQALGSVSQLVVPEGFDVELIVVANACTDSTVSMCQSYFSKIPFAARCIEESEPGLSVARNCAVSHSRHEVCAFLEDDIYVYPQWINGLFEVYRDYEDAQIVGGKIDLWWQAVAKPNWLTSELEKFSTGWLDLGDEILQVTEPSQLLGGNYSFKRCLFEKIGPYRSDLGRVGRVLLGGEETDFTRRALQNGVHAYYTPHALIKHWVPPERATVQYMAKVSGGHTRSEIRMRPAFGPRAFLRCVVGHFYLMVKHQILRWFALLRSDRTASIRHLIIRTQGLHGMIEGLHHGFKFGKVATKTNE